MVLGSYFALTFTSDKRQTILVGSIRFSNAGDNSVGQVGLRGESFAGAELVAVWSLCSVVRHVCWIVFRGLEAGFLLQSHLGWGIIPNAGHYTFSGSAAKALMAY